MRSVTKEFTVVLGSGKTVTAEVESEWVHDSSYGADADGNRGTPVDFMENLWVSTSIDDPKWELDDNGFPLTQDEKEEAERLLLEKAEHDPWDEAFYDNNVYDF